MHEYECGLLCVEYAMSTRDLPRCQLADQEAEVTFCVKEFKAMLSFCEATEQDIHIFFEKAGWPILMSSSADASHEVLDLVRLRQL